MEVKGETTKVPLQQGSNKLADFAPLYKNELLESVLPFWLKHSKDERNGGYFTCLDQEGKVFDSDKFVWLQGREVWCFSYMYNNVEQKPEWLELSFWKSLVETLKETGISP